MVGAPHSDELRAGLDRIREELDVPAAFPPEVEEAAAAAADRFAATRDDQRALPLVTLDPPGSRDLDQAFALERRPGGFTIWYAIADVAAFVVLGGPVDDEARRRGVTLYLPDGRAPLHPTVLSEGSASLLPGVDRPAVLWRLDVDDAGRLTSGRARRALVHSTAQLDYPTLQARFDAGAVAEPGLSLLPEIGETLAAAERARGGVSLPIADQAVQDGKLAWRVALPVENWNAQLSLLCGRAAANLMLQGGVGLLRTMPPFADDAVTRLRRAAGALGVPWPEGQTSVAYPAFVRSLDPTTAAGAALANQAGRALRGAGYAAFGPGIGPAPSGADARHSAVAAPYAHVTAPLRRLGDRFAAEAALSVAAQIDVPEWVLEGLGSMPELLARAGGRAGNVERAVVDLAEAVVLGRRLGSVLSAVVVGVDPERGSDLQLLDPPVRARTETVLELGADVAVRVESADPVARRVGLVPVEETGAP